MAKHPGAQAPFDASKLLDPKKYDIELKSAEKPEELQSQLKREEAEAEHKPRTQEAEEAHKRRIGMWVHVFVMAIVAVAFIASVYIAIAKNPTTGLPDKAMGIIMAIVAAGVG